MGGIKEHLLISLTVVLTVYAQIVVKWQVNKAGFLPEFFIDKLKVLVGLYTNLWVISAVAAAFLAGLCWMAAISRLQLSYAYPFMSLTFVLVVGLSSVFFNEGISFLKVLGLILIILGLVVGSRG